MNQPERQSDQAPPDRYREPTTRLIDAPTPPQPSPEHLANLEKVFAAGRRLREQARISQPPQQLPGYEHEPGYTHHWVVRNSTPAQAAAIAKEALDLANQCGIDLRRSSLDNREPQFKPDSIRFNAHAAGREDFHYPPDQRWNAAQRLPSGYGSCATDATPYDLLVGAVVLAIKQHLGLDVVARSEGGHITPHGRPPPKFTPSPSRNGTFQRSTTGPAVQENPEQLTPLKQAPAPPTSTRQGTQQHWATRPRHSQTQQINQR